MTAAPPLLADRTKTGPDPASSRPYLLRCPVCQESYQDDGLRLDCAVAHRPGLLRTEYAASFAPAPASGPFRYRCWLPTRGQVLPESRGGATYRAERLGRALGLKELWVAFSGYWPERGATLATGSFKELEAQAVLARLPERPPVLVVASAGNTAAAFQRVCSDQGVECVLVVPDAALPALAAAGERAYCVRLVTVAGDYSDAIELADAIATRPGFQAEGGTRNVARRDGLGTAFLSAAETIGRLPDHYVQAVGSGAGAIAAHEAARRLLANGMPGSKRVPVPDRMPEPARAAASDGKHALPSGASTRSGAMEAGTTESGATGSGPTGSGPTGSGPTGSGPTGSGPTGSGPTGSGAIDVRLGGLPQLTLCQNTDYAPMFHAWQNGSAEPDVRSESATRAAVARAYARELTTRTPPYAVAGGVREILAESGGELRVADRAEAVAAARLFADAEGIDIEPAAAVAVAGLRQAVAAGQIRPEETVLLHVTGGGRARRRAATRAPVATGPDLSIPAGLDVRAAADLVTGA
ncbi:pyridoxal-phosphate dependent enzyme [Streptomyces sp. NPDC006711]|uniref:pyridoxal-phosphate dependent enzyme n=1 Tax=Streptomyces sp. NPDC006711 TaxID=3364762 RepID=UPI0036A3037C